MNYISFVLPFLCNLIYSNPVIFSPYYDLLCLLLLRVVQRLVTHTVVSVEVLLHFWINEFMFSKVSQIKVNIRWQKLSEMIIKNKDAFMKLRNKLNFLQKIVWARGMMLSKVNLISKILNRISFLFTVYFQTYVSPNSLAATTAQFFR